ncbi:MAG: helix-turn-helix transcriptional regulator [Acidimicrobiales bacterium]
MTEWSVYVETRPHKDHATVDDSTVMDGVAQLLDLLSDYGASTAGDHRGWSAWISLAADDAADALSQGVQVVFDYAKKAGLPYWPIIRSETVQADVFDAEQAAPNFPALMGTQEVTDLLGVSRQRLHELRSSGRFPEPIVRLASGPVWLQPAVDKFLEGWERLPGRPSNEAVAAARRELTEISESLEDPDD